MNFSIQMVDLTSQYKQIKEEIDQVILKVLGQGNFIKGKEVDEFEEALASKIGATHCISCGNGTDALQIALMALHLKPGDEIIVPAFTYIAPVEAIALLGLKPILVDVDPDTFNINPEFIEQALTPKTRAILCVHLFGQTCDMNPIRDICRTNNLFLIEDNAQSINAEYITEKRLKAGTIGNIGTTSFFPSKNLGCYGDGGAVFTNDENLARLIREICNHGQKEKYIHNTIGINSRLDTIQAAILKIKLKYLDKYIQKRQEAAQFYDIEFKNLEPITIPKRVEYSSHVFHQYTIKVNSSQRNKLKDHLESKQIPSMIYYSLPVHLQPGYQFLGYSKGDFPIAEKLCTEVLSLPMHTELDAEQIEYICNSIKSFYN